MSRRWQRRAFVVGAIAWVGLWATQAIDLSFLTAGGQSAFAIASNRRGDKVIFPTLAAPGSGAPRGASAASAPLGSGPVEFGGGVSGYGVMIGTPRVYVVFWGSQWGTSSTGGDGYVHLSNDTAGLGPRLQAMYAGLGRNGEQWTGVSTQYCEGVPAGAASCPPDAAHVGYPFGGALAGVWVDNATPTPTQATESQIADEAESAAVHFGDTTEAQNADAQYVIASPSGTHPDGFGTAGFCAWHSADASPVGVLAFTNFPYVIDLGASCGVDYVHPGAVGQLDGVTITAGHEFAETLTDPIPGAGWSDSVGFEVADKCAWIGVGGTGGAQDVAFATGAFPMTGLWSNDDNACVIAHQIVLTIASDVVTAVGSPLTEGVMDQVLNGPDQYDLHASGVPTVVVPADQYCGQVTYGATSAAAVPPPRNSDEGLAALAGSTAGTYPDPTTDAGHGCVTIARSDLPPTG